MAHPSHIVHRQVLDVALPAARDAYAVQMKREQERRDRGNRTS